MMDIYIVYANTFGHPPFGKLVLRYIGYYISLLPLMLGFFWVGWDKRKQGFHDKIAGTVVVKGLPDQAQVLSNTQDDEKVETEVSGVDADSRKDAWTE